MGNIMLSRNNELRLLATFFLLAGFSLVFWLPNDIQTGMFDTYRHQTNIGDAFMPISLLVGIMICSALRLILLLKRPNPALRSEPVIGQQSLVFLIVISAVISVSLIIMFWAGPIAVSLYYDGHDRMLAYRQLRATWPWSILGFACGGFIMTFGITSVIIGRFRIVNAIAALLAVALLVLAFDVPFDKILLPPNGDW